jgi:hypothetical protein
MKRNFRSLAVCATASMWVSAVAVGGSYQPSFSELDANKDNVGTRDEVAAKLPDVAFETIDSNGDDRVSSLEYGAYIDSTLSGSVGNKGQESAYDLDVTQ